MKSKLQQQPPKNRKAKSPNEKDKPGRLFSYAKYSGLAFQMGAIIFLGTWGGYKLDQFLGFNFPAFTLFLSVSAVVIAIYWAIKDFIQ